MELIDSHCHLHSPFFDINSLNNVIKDALENNVTKIISCSSDPISYDDVLKSTKFPEINITIGFQPTLADKYNDIETLKKFALANQSKILAIGEVGLDYYWIKDDQLRDKQEMLFIDIINFTNDLNLPIVVHSRKAENRALDILEKYSQVPVLLHSFDGNLNEINRAIDLGYKISIPTNVVIRKNRRKVAIRAGIENITLETDAPFCSPSSEIEPNVPSSIAISAKKLSQILELDLNEIATVTTKNAINFYNL